jgi:hypothetical protein
MKKTNRKKHTRTIKSHSLSNRLNNTFSDSSGNNVIDNLSDEQKELNNLLIEADKITLNDLEFDKILKDEKNILCDIRKILKKESGLQVDLSVCNKTDSAKNTQHAEKLVTQLKKHKNMSRQKVILGKDDIILSKNTPPIRNYIILRKKNKPINKNSKKTKTL